MLAMVSNDLVRLITLLPVDDLEKGNWIFYFRLLAPAFFEASKFLGNLSHAGQGYRCASSRSGRDPRVDSVDWLVPVTRSPSSTSTFGSIAAGA